MTNSDLHGNYPGNLKMKLSLVSHTIRNPYPSGNFSVSLKTIYGVYSQSMKILVGFLISLHQNQFMRHISSTPLKEVGFVENLDGLAVNGCTNLVQGYLLYLRA